MAQKQVYDLTPNVALEFFRLKYPEEEKRSTMKASMKGLDVKEEDNELPAGAAIGNDIAQAAGVAAAQPEAVEVGAGNEPACRVSCSSSGSVV